MSEQPAWEIEAEEFAESIKPRCAAHTHPEPCPTCESYIAGGL